MVNSFCGDFLLHAHAILQGEFFFYKLHAGLYNVGSFLHALCWFLSLGSFSYMVYAGFFMWGISSVLYKTREQKSKTSKSEKLFT